MGTGGNLPTNITQTISLFNTTGVIEKDKNIYFCPFIDRTVLPNHRNETIGQKWLRTFKGLLSSTTGVIDDYQDITISQWNPADRNLKIKANADDFRAVSNEGYCFNYLILERVLLDETQGSEIHRYAFFINGVTQMGIGSVMLDLEPDHFTTAFYLSNKSRVRTSPVDAKGYIDVFNPVMKNNFVARQMYDRYVLNEDTDKYKETNLDIFANIEETFKYKRQFRDYHKWLNYGQPDALDLSEEEIEDIENNVSWGNLTSHTKNVIIQKCLIYLNCVFNRQDVCINTNITNRNYFVEHERRVWQTPFQNYPNSYLPKGLTNIVIPTYYIPNEFKSYKEKIVGAFENAVLKCDNYDLIIQPETGFYYILDLLAPTSYVLRYISSAYITKESVLSKNIDIEDGEITLYCTQLFSANYDEELPMFACMPIYNDVLYRAGNDDIMLFDALLDYGTAYFRRSVDTQHNTVTYTFKNMLADQSETNCISDIAIGFIINDNDLSCNLDLSEKELSLTDIEENYVDPVLTFNPYSFYGISYLGRVETVLNKIHFYENPNIKLECTFSVSDVLKYSVLPVYSLEGLEQRFYSESLESTVSNEVMIVTDKLTDYMIANQTQMKNQYAVNDADLGHGVSSTMVSTVGNVLSAYGDYGGFGAVGSVVGGGVSLINNAITWAENTQRIALNQHAKMADVGHLPSNLKQMGTDLSIDIFHEELGLYLNHYKIDTVSYNSICKYLERFGYLVNIYDDLHVNTRVGWDFVQLVSFDYDAEFTIEQEDSIRQIFEKGVTLLHDTTTLHGDGHNYEVSLQE